MLRTKTLNFIRPFPCLGIVDASIASALGCMKTFRLMFQNYMFLQKAAEISWERFDNLSKRGLILTFENTFSLYFPIFTYHTKREKIVYRFVFKLYLMSQNYTFMQKEYRNFVIAIWQIFKTRPALYMWNQIVHDVFKVSYHNSFSKPSQPLTDNNQCCSSDA